MHIDETENRLYKLMLCDQNKISVLKIIEPMHECLAY